MKRNSKVIHKYALSVSKLLSKVDFDVMEEKDIDRYIKFSAIENQWRDGNASNSSIVNAKWCGVGVLGE